MRLSSTRTLASVVAIDANVREYLNITGQKL